MIVCLFGFQEQALALEDNEIQIDTFKLLVRENSTSEAFPIKDAEVNVFGSTKGENKAFLLGKTRSNEEGEIKGLTYKAQRSFNQVHFQYLFGNEKRGYLIRLTDYNYNANHTREIPNDRRINATRTSSISGENGTATFYVELAKLNNVYYEVFENQKLAVEKAAPYMKMKKTTFEAIDIVYDRELIMRGNSFNRNGKEKISNSILCINTEDTSDWDWDRTCAVTHEWAHWNMFRVNRFPSDPYESHYSYNDLPETSYKEGWAVFQRHQYTCGLTKEFSNDDQVQTDKRLYGVSTNYTVKGALYDIYDDNFGQYRSIEDDSFDIYTLLVNGDHSIEERALISEGIMYMLMIESRAKTFKEFYQYLVTNYVDKHPDKEMKQKLIRAMAVNGINEEGEFMVKK